MKHLLLCLLTLSFAANASAREWFVRQADPNAPNASDTADGSSAHPLRTINAAAQLAQPGDIVSVGPGIYHEWVSPVRGGAANAPIVYRSIPEHTAIVRGSDLLDTPWQPLPDAPGVFAAPLPAFVFGNPFIRPPPSKKQPIQKCNALVFLNDQPLTQVTTRQDLLKTPNTWLSTDDGHQLLLHLQGDTAPAKGAIEITTRDRIFAPHRRGLSYITVEGFTFERCATHPDWPQLGALSTRSGQYWTLRNNIVRYTTGKGIDCGSETWDPQSLLFTEKEDKHILIANHNLVQGNLVTNNTQCGIAAWNTDFVRIIGNTLRDNCASASADDRTLTDFEAGAIKVHAFRNGLIEGNLVADNSSFGIWLDNGWESARVTRNLCFANRGAGIFVELGFGPILVDHNLSAANIRLGVPYLGDGLYTHDASGVTITHNTFLDNAHDGIQQLIVSERIYWPKRLAEASNETITANLFLNNHDAAISLPLTSPRAHDNHSDYNALAPSDKFIINTNNNRIPMEMILRECRDRLQAAELPDNQRPDLSNSKHPPTLSLPAWQAIMQLDQTSAPLAPNLHMHVDPQQNQLQIDLPTPDTIPTAPATPADDFDLLGQPIKTATPRAGAIEHLQAGPQTITLWPLPAVLRQSP